MMMGFKGLTKASKNCWKHLKCGLAEDAENQLYTEGDKQRSVGMCQRS